MSKYGDKSKRDKKDIPRKKPEKEKIFHVVGWDPVSIDGDDNDDCGITFWMQWQKEGCFKKRKPTDVDEFRNLPSDKCADIFDIGNFEYNSLAESFRKNIQHSNQCNVSTEKTGEPILKLSKSSMDTASKAELSKRIKLAQSSNKKDSVDSTSSSTKLQNKNVVELPGSTKLQNNNTTDSSCAKTSLNKSSSVDSSSSRKLQCKNDSVSSLNSQLCSDKDLINDEGEEIVDEGYESKISSSEDNSTEIRPVPLLDLVAVTGDHVADDNAAEEKPTSSFRWLREKDDQNNKVIKVTYAQDTDAQNTSVYRHNIINSSRAFVTDYIKRCQPNLSKTHYSNGDKRPQSLVLSKVGIQDSNREESIVYVPVAPVLHNTSPELNVSNLKTKTVSDRTSSRLSTHLANRGSSRCVDSRNKYYSDSYFPMKELLPAVDQNIQEKQTERITKHSVEEYYGKIGCGEDNMSRIEALSRSLDKHIGPPPFRPHYLRSPLQKARESSNKRSYGNLVKFPDGSDTYHVYTPRYFVDNGGKRRSGSADRLAVPVVSGPFKRQI